MDLFSLLAAVTNQHDTLVLERFRRNEYLLLGTFVVTDEELGRLVKLQVIFEGCAFVVVNGTGARLGHQLAELNNIPRPPGRHALLNAPHLAKEMMGAPL